MSATETTVEGSSGNCVPEIVTQKFPYDEPVLGTMDKISDEEKFNKREDGHSRSGHTRDIGMRAPHPERTNACNELVDIQTEEADAVGPTLMDRDPSYGGNHPFNLIDVIVTLRI
jgi:hypothetical protein